MISLDDCEKALQYLTDTDLENAQAKGRVEYEKHNAKTQYAIALLEAKANTVADRSARAQTDPAYEKTMQAYRDAIVDAELVRTKRKRAELTVEVWRSLNAARGRGQII